MFYPTRVQLKYWFYPTGNTPAVNLLRDIPPSDQDEDTVNLLLLACGDPRNILFGLWCEQGHDIKRNYRFTCCDIEPAVLARNVLLLTLIAERCACTHSLSDNDEATWNIFYHLFIPKSSLLMLRRHAGCLLDASITFEQWLSSPYGKFIGYVSRETLAALRKFWASYAAIDDSGQLEIKARDTIAKRSKEIGNSDLVHGARSAGPFWMNAMTITPYAYREFWKTGVVGGNAADVADLGNSGKGFVNPMFAMSSAPAGDYAVHYGTEPMLGFPLAHAFHEQPGSGAKDVVKKTKEIVRVAKAQFKDWHRSFKKYLERGRIRVDFFDGDASALCFDMQLESAVKTGCGPRTYIKPWCFRPLVFDGRVSPFDVIDTSNLCDHIGLINMLTATAPLLRKTSSAVLYTETLLLASEHLHEILSTVLGTDIVTFALLLGIAPVGLLSGVTLEAVGNELGMFTYLQGDEDKTQCRIRIPWKTLETTVQAQSINISPRARFEPQPLARCLFNIYKKMFEHEDVSTLLPRMKRMQFASYSTDMERYTRAAMVALLRIVRKRAIADWESTMRLFIEEVQKDTSLIIGSNSLQELFMHLHCFGLWSVDVLKQGPRQLAAPGLKFRPKSAESGLLAQQTIPAVIHLLFAVPRKALNVFTSRSADVIGTPAIHVAVCQSASRYAYENIFSSFNAGFGRLTIPKGDVEQPTITEDDRGWKGSGDLIVSCSVPSHGLLIGPRDSLRVSLMIKTSVSTVATFQQYLGPRLQVYETDLNNVFISHDAPKLSCKDVVESQHQWVAVTGSHPKPLSHSVVKLKPDFATSHLQQHLDFPPGSSESKALLSGCVVKVVDVSPSEVLLHVGDIKALTLHFPFFVQGSQSKVRVARKSSWVEVEVPVYKTPMPDKFDNWTRLMLAKGHPPVLWSLSKVNLAIQPEIDFPSKASASWISPFLGFGLSDSERLLQGLHQATTTYPKYDLKQSMGTMFSSFAGLNPRSSSGIKVFQLTVNNSCHTIIFTSALRHDLDLGSIVLDAWVLPLTIARVHELQRALGVLMQKQTLGIVLSREESILWKRLLPALAERCRTWSHKSTCEYLEGSAPLSTEDDKPPICSCGQGKVPAGFAKDHKEWKPFTKYLTRIAIAPIFPVPYAEPSMTEYRSRFQSMTKDLPTGQSSKSGCDNCRKTDKPLKACARCGKARYCGQECQKQAWISHKAVCKAK